MPDGAALPYRRWLPDGAADTVVLALHGFNDSRDAFEIPAPDMAAAGIAVYAPDQRGFGAAPGRGSWAGPDRLCADAATMLRTLGQWHSGARLFALGESMGGAVLLRLAGTAPPPGVAGHVLVAPAVWSRSQMDLFLRGSLWLASRTVPEWTIKDGGPIHVRASDNIPALRRLSRDPLTLHTTQFGTLRGLVDLMDDAQRAAGSIATPTLWLYGARDELVPTDSTRSAWRRVPSEAPVRFGFYPNDYHLILRDLDRASPTADLIGWLADHAAPLPSGADVAARIWVAQGV